MSTDLKVGMIGAGFILKSHADAVAQVAGASLHAVADISEKRARQAAAEFGFTHALASADDLAASDCDVVHVLVPPAMHVEVAEKMLRARKSVFLEKPMGLQSHECQALERLANERNVRLGVNHNFLFLPGYERLRSAVLDRKFGRIDRVSCNWLFDLPQLRGPANVWMLDAPANLFFEIGPHLAAFILDLMGPVEVIAGHSGDPLLLPNKATAYRAWDVLGRNARGTFSAALSARPGQADRILRVRGSGGSAQLDFGRDIYWEETTLSANPIFDAHSVAKSIVAQVGSAAGRDRRRRLGDALRKRAGATPFDESMLRSIEAFYASPDKPVDVRHSADLGTKVIKFCETVATKAGVGQASNGFAGHTSSTAQVQASPTVLVVGGTGFIGRKLVAKLLQEKIAVRVLSRSRETAEAVFAGLQVDIAEGSHGNTDEVRRALSGIETVYHLAKCEGKRWDDYVHHDINPTRVLAEESISAGIKRFIYSGTIDSYASSNPASRITGDTPLDSQIRSRNHYARSKAECETLLRELHAQHGLPLVIVRPGIVIGVGAPFTHLGVANFASETQVQFWGRGDNNLPIVLVDDVADALVLAAAAPKAVGRSFLLTSDPILSARDYLDEVSKCAGVQISAVSRAPWRYWLADVIKETAKNIIRHPNRRIPSLHDWQCRAHRAVYDSSDTRDALRWNPASDRAAFVSEIRAAVADQIK